MNLSSLDLLTLARQPADTPLADRVPAPPGAEVAPVESARGRPGAGAAPASPEMRQAAQQFEAIFLRQLLGQLGKGLSAGKSSGVAGSVYGSMVVDAVAGAASEGGGIGLSEIILRSMLAGQPSDPKPLFHDATSAVVGTKPDQLGAESTQRVRKVFDKEQ